MSVKGESSKRTEATPEPPKVVVGNLHKDIKTKLPERYDGNRPGLKAFLTQIELYLGFNSDKFNSETEQVLYAVTLLEGAALSWIEPFVADYITHRNATGAVTTNSDKTTIDLFLSWKGFREGISTVFGDIDPERTAERTIQNLRQRGSAATYTSEFQRYSGRTDWNDDALKAQYYRGLKDSVKDEIARSERPDSLHDMIELAIKIDNRAYERQLEKRGQYSAGYSKKSKGKNSYWPQPMELDAAQKIRPKPSEEEMARRREKKLCFECGLPGHMASSHKKGKGKKPWEGRRKQLNATGHVHRVVSRDGGLAWQDVLSKGAQQELLATVDEGQLFLVVEIKGESIRALIDSGATGNFVSPKVVGDNGWETRVKEEPYTLYLVDGEEASSGQVEVETLPLVMAAKGQHLEDIQLDVTEMSHDIILGMPWIRKHNPQIDWATGKVTFSNCSCVRKAAWTAPVTLARKEVCATSPEESGHQAQGPLPEQIAAEYREFKEMFEDRKDIRALPEHRPWDHEIPLREGASPPFSPLYRMSEDNLRTLREYVDKYLKKGYIRESSSPAGAPTLFAPKADGTPRWCIDYRKLNDMTVKDRYALPLADQLRDSLRGAKIFTQLDLREAYHLIRMKEGEEWKTAFRTPYGHYECLVMWEGLTNAPATCQRLLHNVLRPYLDKTCVSYLDDILVYSADEEQHRKDVRDVLTALREAGLRLKPEKCHFYEKEVTFLGYVVKPEGISMDPKKVATVLEWSAPACVKDVQSFLGFANYYRRFIKGYSGIAAPLTELTRKDKPFEWNDRAQEAFKELKRVFTSAPVLASFTPDKEIRLETDSSDFAIGAVLSQPNEQGKQQPTAFYSRKLSPAELNYEIYDKELLAIVEAFREWRVYLEGSAHPVQVLTDHKNLIYFTTTKELNRRQVRWAETLASYNFRISYVKGSENARADALSRKPEYLSNKTHESRAILKEENDSLVFNRQQIAATSTLVGDPWTKKIKQQYSDDQLAQHQVAGPTRDFTVNGQGVLLFLGRVYVPARLRKELVTELHGLPAHGHQGIRKTRERIARTYYFPGLRKTVEQVVTNCDTCIRNKAARHAPYGQLTTPKTPDRPWKSVAMDFVVKLPLSTEEWTGRQYDSILVVTDRLSKYAYMIPYREASTAEDLSQVLLRTVIANHGMPDEIISDRDKLFTSKFWTTMTALLGSERKLSTAFHPQTDGQTERINQTMEAYLRCYVNYKQNNWVDLLPLAQFAYNSAESEGTGVTPFFANYGYTPEVYKAPLIDTAHAQGATVKVTELRTLHEELSSDIKFIAARSAMYYNKKHSMGPTLKKGNKVYLLRKNVATKRPSDKLDHKKLGPFQIDKKIGPVNYRLKLPATMQIHPVFHVSLLEPAPPGSPPAPKTEVQQLDPQKEYEVESILDCQYFRNQIKYLIKWEGYPHSENTWEPKANLKCPDLLEAFLRQNPGLPKRDQKGRRPRGPRPGPGQGSAQQ